GRGGEASHSCLNARIQNQSPQNPQEPIQVPLRTRESREIREIRDIVGRTVNARDVSSLFLVLCDGARFALQAATHMTCRIDRIVEEDLEIFYVSGRIEGKDLNVLRAAIGTDAGAFAIDLKDVDLIDGDAVTFLAIIEANGGALRNCPAFIREWVNRERAQMRPDQPTTGGRARGAWQ